MSTKAPDNPTNDVLNSETPKQAPYPIPKSASALQPSNDYEKGVLKKLPSDPTSVPSSGRPSTGYSSQPGNAYGATPKKIPSSELKGRELQPVGENDSDSEKQSLGLNNHTPAGLRKSGKSVYTPVGSSNFQYKPEPPRKSTYARIRGRLNRRSVTGIAVAGVISVAGIGFFSIAQGPLSIIHLGELLNLPTRSQDDLNAKRIGGIYRYVRTGGYGETRLGKLESIMNKKILNDFKEQGITMEYNERGRLTKITVDPRTNSQLKDLSAEDRRTMLAEAYDTTPENIKTLGNGRMVVDTAGTKVSVKRKLISNSFNLASKGSASKAINVRVVTKFFGEYSIFHPMKKAEQAVQDKNLTRQQAKAKSKEEQIKKNEEATKLSPEAETEINNVRDKLGFGKNLKVAGAAALSISGTLCVIKDVADTLPKLQFLATVEPAIKGAYTVMSYGSQTKSGDDFNAQQLGDFVGTLTDDAGKSVFQAASLNALGGKPQGEDLDPDYKDAFSPDNKAATISAAISSVPGADALCSPLGQFGQLVAGSVLLVTTAGTGTAIIKTTTGIVSGAVIGKVIGYIEKAIVGPSLSTKVLAGGPLGGNLLAHGAMSAAGMSARNFGGVAFGAVASQEIRDTRIAEYRNEFNQESFTTRMFDIADSRSLAASIIDSPVMTSKTSPSNITRVLSFSNLFSGFGTLFNKSALAADRSYAWTMPEYGFSAKITENPKYQDPYDNADKVATFIEGSDYIDRAETCFGAKIEKEETGWNAVTDNEVNPATGDYQGANCGDESDENWVRVRLFILDTKNMTGFACNEGDNNDPDIQKACTDLGVGGATAPATDGANPAATGNTTPPEAINGYVLTPNEKKSLQYIAEKVKPLLKGTPAEQARVAAESSWWSLREGVLNLPQPYNNVKPFAFSNCGSGDGNTPIGIVATCSATTWQVGIGAVQVPPFSDAVVTSTARSLHNNDPVKDILSEVSILTGNTEGTPIYNQITNSTGILQRSLLLRDPATGITLVNGSMQPCLKTPIPPQADWCTSGGHSDINGSSANIKKAIEELTLYFSGGTN